MAEREVVYSLIGLTITKRALEDKRHMSTIGPQFRDCRPPQDFFFPAWVLGSNGTENSLKDLGRLRATLVIAKIDRLARNVAFVANLMESKVKFVACDMPQANDMTIHIIAAVAQGEAKAISERTKVALAAAKARGVKLGAPHHLTREGGLKGSRLGAATTKRNAVEHYAYIAPTIAAYRAEGLGYLAIAKRLNAAGEETRNGKAWNAAQVRRVLLEAPPAEQPLALSSRRLTTTH